MQTDRWTDGLTNEQTDKQLDFAAHNLWHFVQAILLPCKLDNLAKSAYRELKKSENPMATF